MRIAFPTDNGTTIQRHFGRAGRYAVVTVIVTDEPTIEGALDAWLAGTLASQQVLLHTPGHHNDDGA